MGDICQNKTFLSVDLWLTFRPKHFAINKRILKTFQQNLKMSSLWEKKELQPTKHGLSECEAWFVKMNIYINMYIKW